MLLLVGIGVPLFSQSFFGGTLGGEVSNNPTSLQFGPDNRLYVAQQNGTIYAYTIERDNAAPGSGTYTVLATETILLVKEEVPNHNDDGTINSSNNRQVTGLLVVGTPTNPVLYVTSSDSRISVGNDSGLDTNSGVISRLTWNGVSWDKVDIVRGLPRCEENHAINGLDLDETNNKLYVQQGGHTNKGAPGNNFSGTPEYFFSGSLNVVDLDIIESMPVYTDLRTNTQYVYDLPTLDDPTRTNIDNSSPDFPYGPAHPLFNASIDPGDPFGGNNGLNQAIPEPNGPVQVFSPGYRNAYDIVITENGRLYTSDNGPNGGWGGLAFVRDVNDAIVTDANNSNNNYNNATNPTAIAGGNYITNEFSDIGSSGHGDPIHYAGTINDPIGTYYAGHPAPIRAFPGRAGIINYEEQGNGNWVQVGPTYDFATLISGVQGYFNNTLALSDFPDDPRQAFYSSNTIQSNQGPATLDINSGSSNGITEYTASNFDGALQGDILLCSWGSTVYRYELDAEGDAIENKSTFATPGGNPLDITAQDDDDIFPGTVWVATHGSDNILVYEPNDFGNCPQPNDLDYVGTDDSDFDNYSNEDEVAVGTDHCNGADVPSDNDGDFDPDALDNDDDNDGILDVNDPFQWDPDNGLTTNLPITYPFWNFDPGTGFAGVGFTGWMTDGATDYLNMFDETAISFGGAAGKVGLENIPAGTAFQNANSQRNGFQFGVNVNTSSNPFSVHTRLEPPFFAVNGNASTPIDFQSFGIQIGEGNQDNYLEVSFIANGGSGGIRTVLEHGGTASESIFNVPNILSAPTVDLYISVDPGNNTAQPYYSLDDGATVTPLGIPITLPASYLNPADNFGLAVGIISTSSGSSTPFDASYDFINVTEEMPGVLAALNAPISFNPVPTNSSAIAQDLTVRNEGGPSSGAITVNGINFSGTDASYFSTTAIFPIVLTPGGQINLPILFTPDAVDGLKTATAEVIHSGTNTPLQVSLSAELQDEPVPIVRVNAGGAAITATDGGPNWQANTGTGAQSGNGFSNNTGNVSTHNIPVSGKHSSIPDYMDDATFTTIFAQERWDAPANPELEYSFTGLPNENYVVRLYMGNGYNGTSAAGERVFDISIEGQLVQNDLDLSGTLGHQVGGMFEYLVALTDGTLNILFTHVTENPLVNGIEVLSYSGNVSSPIVLNPIGDQVSVEGDNISFNISATGGDGNLTFSETGLPPSLQLMQIDNNTATISGSIVDGAPAGSPYTVTITVDDTDGDNADIATEVLTWTVFPANAGGNVVYRVNAGGGSLPSHDTSSTGWEEDQSANQANGTANLGTPSPYLNLTGTADLTFGANLSLTNNTGYPDNIFLTERYDIVEAPAMTWTFPVTDGNYTVNLLFAEIWSGAEQPGVRVFDIVVEGNIALDDFDIAADPNGGYLTALVKSIPVEVTDGNLVIEFVHVTQNPAIKGIEILSAEETATIAGTIETQAGMLQQGEDVNMQLYAAGDQPGSPSYNQTMAVGANGQMSMNGIAPGTYDVRVKHLKSISRVMENVALVVGSNTLELTTANSKELRMGDADNNNQVAAIDFSVLASTFNLSDGDAQYDERADFNFDNAVSALDFSLLASNFNTSGEVANALGLENRSGQPVIQNEVNLAFQLPRKTIFPGEIFDVFLMADAQQQPIDAVADYLEFDPAFLDLMDITWTNVLPIPLREEGDAKEGKINLACGAFDHFPEGKMAIAKMTFKAKKAGSSWLKHTTSGPFKPEVTFGGNSILGSLEDVEIQVQGPLMSVKVYPVPSSGQINLEVNHPTASESKVRILNTNGQLVFAQTYEGHIRDVVDLANLTAGIYIVEVRSGTTVLRQRIIKSNE